MANLLECVWEERQRQMEGLYIVVNPSETEAIRQALDRAGYEPVHVLGNKYVPAGGGVLMREADFAIDLPIVPEDLKRPAPQRVPLWRRIRDSAFMGA